MISISTEGSTTGTPSDIRSPCADGSLSSTMLLTASGMGDSDFGCSVGVGITLVVMG